MYHVVTEGWDYYCLFLFIVSYRDSPLCQQKFAFWSYEGREEDNHIFKRNKVLSHFSKKDLRLKSYGAWCDSSFLELPSLYQTFHYLYEYRMCIPAFGNSCIRAHWLFLHTAAVLCRQHRSNIFFDTINCHSSYKISGLYSIVKERKIQFILFQMLCIQIFSPVVLPFSDFLRVVCRLIFTCCHHGFKTLKQS